MRAPLLVALLLANPTVARAAELDEPGAAPLLEEPGLTLRLPVEAAPPSGPRFRLELGFGLSSLVVDPDMGNGMGGGLYLAWGIHRRVGVELSAFFSSNPYTGTLGTYGNSFLAGTITLGPIFQLTRPGSRFMVTLDLAMGPYVIVPLIPTMSPVWSLGFSGGLTIGYRLARWFGIGFKVRYHLFNIGGSELKDVKSLQPMGVVDRLEIPGYLAFYF